MRLYLLSTIFVSVAIGISFDIQNYSTTINVDDIAMENPFSGGTNYARILWIDWDQDDDIDLLMLDEDLFFKYFENIGNINNPQFVLRQYHPIYSISGINWFYLADFNEDGNVDLVTQSSIDPTEVMIYDFNGSGFEYVSILSQSNGEPINSAAVMTPTFSDIDNDGDLDFFTGNMNGTVNYYENIGLTNGVPIFEFITQFWENILIVGPSQSRHGASAIRFIDLDGDQDYDLAWGDYFQRSLYIIWNVGTPESVDMDTENFIVQFPENEPIYTSGQNMPSFADLDGDEDMDLFITILGGDGPIQLNNNFLMFENTGSSTDPYYELSNENFLGSLDLLSDVIPEFVDIDNDGFLDFFVGQDYTTETSPTRGRLYFFENEGLSHPTFSLADSAFLGTEIGLSLSPEFIDIDNDNDFDLFVGEYNGKINYFENIGTSNQANFIDNGFIDNIDLGFYSVPEFCDIDADGDQDLFIGNYNGQIYHYENTGTSEEFVFIESTFVFDDLETYSRSAPRFKDLDYDGDYDLLLGTANSGVHLYWNIGTQSEYNFIKDQCIEMPYLGANIKPSIYDIDSNGSFDLLTGLSTGGFLHYTMSRFLDLNFDNNIDIFDIILTIHEVLYPGNLDCQCYGDANHDTNIDILDVLIFVDKILQD